MKIALLTWYSDKIAYYGKYSAQIMKKYAEQQKYDFILERRNTLDNTRPYIWSKLLIIKEHLYDYDWVLYIDADAVIMNFNTRIEKFIDEYYNIILAEDKISGMNAGVMLIKNNDWSKSFLNYWFNQKQFDTSKWKEQDALRWIYENNTYPGVNTKIKLIPQKDFNSLTRTNMYSKEDFILHYAGSQHNRWGIRLYTKYLT